MVLTQIEWRTERGLNREVLHAAESREQLERDESSSVLALISYDNMSKNRKEQILQLHLWPAQGQGKSERGFSRQT